MGVILAGSKRIARALAVLLVLSGPVRADPRDALASGGDAAVAEVIDGDTVVLDDGRQVRLVGLQAPKLALGREGFKEWPLAADAKAALAGLVRGRPVSLGYGGLKTDRHGRALAHLFLPDGTWVQGWMLAQGWARVYTFADNRALAAEMLAAEAQARTGKRGIWGHPFYAVRTPEQTARLIGTFQVIEGRVLDAAKVKGRIYLNFGPDWRTDFTVSIGRTAAKLFKTTGADPLALKGRTIRVRGWLRKRNGPLIEATHPEQVEVF